MDTTQLKKVCQGISELRHAHKMLGRHSLFYSGAKSCQGIKCNLLVQLIDPETAKAALWRSLVSANCLDCVIFGFALFFHFVHFE